MLLKLIIKNYALIDDIEWQPGSNFNIITGETGAGKSIILDAFGLILGNRADATAIKLNSDKCLIEGFFDITNYHLKHLFDLYDLDYDHTCIIRREISNTGKSRSFINDTPVGLNELKIIGQQLVEIHAQHQNLDILQKSYQLSIIDVFSKNQNLLDHYKSDLKLLKIKQTELETEEQNIKKIELEKDYNQFLLDELIALDIKNNEEIELENELNVLANADLIINALSESNLILKDQDHNVLDMLAKIKSTLTQLTKKDNRILEPLELTQQIIDLCKNLESDIKLILNNTNNNSEKLVTIESRFSAIQLVLRKHKLSTSQELLEFQQQLELKFHNIASSIEQKNKLILEIDSITSKLWKQAENIHQIRLIQAKQFEKEINLKIKPLGLDNALITIDMTKNNQLTESGISLIEFKFTPDHKKEAQLIEKTASGGELSRIMIVIKSILASKTALPTIIFDEIDTGISGETAYKTGDILLQMGKTLQVIAITHLPQIAAKGSNHYYVFKNNNNTSISSKIKSLTHDERIQIIAAMISGAKITDSSINSAKELLLN